METKTESIGLEITKARKKLNLTRHELADKIGVSYGAVAKWELGERYPHIKRLIQLEKELKLNLIKIYLMQEKINKIKKQLEDN